MCRTTLTADGSIPNVRSQGSLKNRGFAPVRDETLSSMWGIGIELLEFSTGPKSPNTVADLRERSRDQGRERRNPSSASSRLGENVLGQLAVQSAQGRFGLRAERSNLFVCHAR